MSTKTQIKKIEVLNRCISETEVYTGTPTQSILALPTGDGMCLGFLQGPELPLHLAVQLYEKLAKYNMGKIPSKTVRVRIWSSQRKLFSIIPYYFKDNLKRVYENEKEIGLPEWFKQTVTWWLDDKITNDEFVASVKYLRAMGLIQPH